MATNLRDFMATMADEQEENQSSMNVLGQQNQPLTESPQENQGVTSGSESPTIEQQAQAAPSVAPTTKSAGSGMASNIKKYVAANQPQQQRMSNQLVGGAEKQAQGIGQEVDKQKTEFQERINQQKERMDKANQELFGSAQPVQQTTQSSAPTQQQNEGIFNKILQLKQGEKLNEDQVKTFRDLSDRTGDNLDFLPNQYYQDPVVQRIKKLQTDVERAKSGGQGYSELLQQQFGGKDQNYSRGMRKLDEAILGLSTTGKDTLRQGFENQLSEAQRLSGQGEDFGREGLRNIISQEEDFTKRLNEEFANRYGGLTGGLESKAQAEEDFRNRLLRNEVMKSDLEKLGVGNLLSGDNISLYGVNPYEFMPKFEEGTDITGAMVANPEELARLNAFRQLEDQPEIFQTGSDLGVNNPERFKQFAELLGQRKSDYERNLPIETGQIADIESGISGIGSAYDEFKSLPQRIREASDQIKSLESDINSTVKARVGTGPRGTDIYQDIPKYSPEQKAEIQKQIEDLRNQNKDILAIQPDQNEQLRQYIRNKYKDLMKYQVPHFSEGMSALDMALINPNAGYADQGRDQAIAKLNEQLAKERQDVEKLKQDYGFNNLFKFLGE